MSQEFEEIPHSGGTSIIVSGLRRHYGIITRTPLSKAGAAILLVYLTTAVLAPYIVPHDPGEIQRADDGSVARFAEPGTEHLFGTTNYGRDVFSQTIVSARVSMFVGLVAAFMGIVIGTTVGITSAFYGGLVDDVLMRFVDIVYALPFIPFIFILALFFGQGLFNITLAIALVLWRASSRVIRSQTLSIKQRPYIEAARAAGVGNFRLMYRHILPNVLPLAFLYGSFAIGAAILAEAGVAFLGMGDPNLLSWGKMINLAYSTGSIRRAPWWAIAPGISITLVVVSVFLISREYEQVANPELEDTVQQ